MSRALESKGENPEPSIAPHTRQEILRQARTGVNVCFVYRRIVVEFRASSFQLRGEGGDHLPLCVPFCCIMPTCDREGWISVALMRFLSQDWPDKELVVIDDGAAKVDCRGRRADDIRQARGIGIAFGRLRRLLCGKAAKL